MHQTGTSFIPFLSIHEAEIAYFKLKGVKLLKALFRQDIEISEVTISGSRIYKGLELTFKNKNTDDTNAVKEQIISLIANMKVMDSNPLPGEEVRIGIIDYERDPEKFLFN